jgi:hypothetical protein
LLAWVDIADLMDVPECYAEGHENGKIAAQA